MDGKIFRERDAFSGRFQLPPECRSISGVVLFFLLFGVLCGSIVGLYSSLRVPWRWPLLPSAGSDQAFSTTLLALGSPFLLLLFFAGSFYGLVAAPITVFLCGLQTGHSVALCFNEGAYRGLLVAILKLGPVLLFLLPCAVLCSVDCFLASRALIQCRFGRGSQMRRAALGAKHVLFTALMLLLSALYLVFVYPLLSV